MNYKANGVQIDLPENFFFGESSVTFFLDETKEKENTNLVLQRQKNIDLSDARQVAELVKKNVENSALASSLKNIKIQDFIFADSKEGAFLSFKLSDGKELNVTQFQVVRIDDEIITTATLTLDSSKLNSSSRKIFMASLASITPES